MSLLRITIQPQSIEDGAMASSAQIDDGLKKVKAGFMADINPNDANNCEEEEGENVFYFESDHLALRGNADYSNVLRTISILEVQRMRVHQQLEELELAKQRYLNDPELFLQKLRNNEPIISPNYMTVAKLPDITTPLDVPATDIKIKEEPLDVDVKPPMVRGRIVDEFKPDTFNRLWSCEEQRRLEQLLIEYPAEAIESRRYVKIAKALGNRTPQQVSSRVQKYFQKLHDAGLPIPGRKPKNRRGGQTKTKHFYRPTTFFPAYNVPVHMPEDDFLMDELRTVSSPAPADGAAFSSDGTSSADYMETLTQRPEEERTRLLHMLQVIRDEKQNTPDGYQPDPLAAKCYVCGVAAVSRTRWHCNTCYTDLNQCTDCTVQQLLTQKFEHITHDIVDEQVM